MEQNHNEQFHEMLTSFDTVMLTTFASDHPVARPMGIVKVEDNCDCWFFTADRTEKVGEVKSDVRALITCQRDHGAYLCLSGTATVVYDRKKIDELWKESFRTWFPEGKDDNNLALIKVTADEGEFWDTRGVNGLNYLFQRAKAYMTSTNPKVDENQHGRVKL